MEKEKPPMKDVRVYKSAENTRDFSRWMKLYSNRRKMNKLREVIQDVEDEDMLKEKK